jgi:hypothetical protein
MRFKVCILFFLTLSVSLLLHAQGSEELPLIVQLQIDTQEIDRTSRFTFKIDIEVLEAPQSPLQVRLGVYSGSALLFRRDHAPFLPSLTWQKGQRISYSLPSLFPLNTTSSQDDTPLEVYIGFYDTQEQKNKHPQGLGKILENQRFCGTFMPPQTRSQGFSEEEEKKFFEEAQQLKKSKDLRTAWDFLESFLRKSSEYPQKKRIRQELEKLGFFEPHPLTPEEKQIVASRINEEKIRYMRLKAGQLYDQEKYRAAYTLLKKIGGQIELQSQEAVIGALEEAKRNEKDLDGIREKILGNLSEEDKTIYKQLIDLDDTPHKKKLLQGAKRLLKTEKKALALQLLRRLHYSRDREVSDEADALALELEEEIIGALSPEDKEAIRLAEHPEAWSRLSTQVSHKFIFIGPQVHLQNLIANKKSLRSLDLAYLFLTDLFHYTPNPGGDRLTIFFKELWDFGGGVGGGKIIDIGRADPFAKEVRVDTGLFYHELTHCIATISPGYDGFNEGIANFGAAFCFEVLDQKADLDHSFRYNLEAFQADYVERDLEFWRIPKYGPSAGFFLHFMEKYAKNKKQYEWSRYRQFFYEYRYKAPRDGRPRETIRALAYLFMQHFGAEALDDLIRFRFPLDPTDRDILAKEFTVQRPETDALRAYPNSPYLRDYLYESLKQALRSEKNEAIQSALKDLGIVFTYKICGPFYKEEGSAHAAIFPPEYELDWTKTYADNRHTALWRVPQEKTYITQKRNGWVDLDFPYPENTAYYAFTQVSSPQEQTVLIHLRADDDFKLFVNDRFIGTMNYFGTNDSQYSDYRNEWGKVPDQIRFPVKLQKGRNKILLKITNHYGPCGFTMALSDLQQNPLPELVYDTELPPPRSAPTPPKWSKSYTFPFQQKNSLRSIECTVGELDIQQKCLVGIATAKEVQWRKYTVRPGFPKDSPSNLFWLPSKITQKDEDFFLMIQLFSPYTPKFTITFDGEGKEDGLSGWTLLFYPEMLGLKVHLERYDTLYYESEVLKIPEELVVSNEGLYQILLEYVEERLSLQVNQKQVFQSLPLLPLKLPKNHTIGMALWDSQVRIQSIFLKK